MKFFQKSYDGGSKSGVTGFFLVEIKSIFSIVLLRFSEGTRENFHNHAFNALTFWLKGRVIEHDISGEDLEFRAGQWKYTPRSKFHKINSQGVSWALSFRGPWQSRWKEYNPSYDEYITLTHGRKMVE